jgi:predicted SAM-dependent methyltransferase
MRLHLGCGKRHIPGFVHVDLDDFPHIEHRCSIETLPMFGNDTADLIYCSHAFPYIDRVRAIETLIEWRRVLRPGGMLRLAVSDFEALVQVYQRTGDLNQILGPLFGRITIRTAEGSTILYHHSVYDYKSLEALLLDAGFQGVRRYDWRETIHRDYDDFSRAYKLGTVEEPGLLISLNVEAVK